jgi:hypothetical protein
MIANSLGDEKNAVKSILPQSSCGYDIRIFNENEELSAMERV